MATTMKEGPPCSDTYCSIRWWPSR